MRINQNIEAINAHRNLLLTSLSLSKSMEKLSSGLRINRAADDAAGLAISEKLRGQVKGLNQAIRNAQDGISLIQTAEGALNETHSILQRMRELAVQAANDTLTNDDRAAIQKEIDSLLSEVDRIATTTEFNTQKLLNGYFTGTTALNFQIGANTGQTIAVQIDAATTAALTVSGLNVGSATLANQAIASLDDAIKQVSGSRAALGAVQNRLEHTIANLGVASENLAASESRIRDVDMAEEMMNFTRTQILQQAGTAMLAQANATPQTVLQLLR
ncbi:MAG TPA: flagellin FliC [Firmicutes bacterium]|nr:flagellin FliC [Bacillota bacterium]